MVISQLHHLAFGWGEVSQCLHHGTGELLPSLHIGVVKAILCDTHFSSYPAAMRRFGDALPPVAPLASGLPAQSPSLSFGTSHKSMQGACAGKAGTERSENMPCQGT
jgi:hypothetical protein